MITIKLEDRKQLSKQMLQNWQKFNIITMKKEDNQKLSN